MSGLLTHYESLLTLGAVCAIARDDLFDLSDSVRDDSGAVTDGRNGGGVVDWIFVDIWDCRWVGQLERICVVQDIVVDLGLRLW